MYWPFKFSPLDGSRENDTIVLLVSLLLQIQKKQITSTIFYFGDVSFFPSPLYLRIFIHFFDYFLVYSFIFSVCCWTCWGGDRPDFSFHVCFTLIVYWFSVFSGRARDTTNMILDHIQTGNGWDSRPERTLGRGQDIDLDDIRSEACQSLVFDVRSTLTFDAGSMSILVLGGFEFLLLLHVNMFAYTFIPFLFLHLFVYRWCVSSERFSFHLFMYFLKWFY